MHYDTKRSGKRIKELRNQMGLTQENLADYLHISVSTLGKFESGFSRVSIELLVEMADLFNV